MMAISSAISQRRVWAVYDQTAAVVTPHRAPDTLLREDVGSTKKCGAMADLCE